MLPGSSTATRNVVFDAPVLPRDASPEAVQVAIPTATAQASSAAGQRRGSRFLIFPLLSPSTSILAPSLADSVRDPGALDNFQSATPRLREHLLLAIEIL